MINAAIDRDQDALEKVYNSDGQGIRKSGNSGHLKKVAPDLKFNGTFSQVFPTFASFPSVKSVPPVVLALPSPSGLWLSCVLCVLSWPFHSYSSLGPGASTELVEVFACRNARQRLETKPAPLMTLRTQWDLLSPFAGSSRREAVRPDTSPAMEDPMKPKDLTRPTSAFASDFTAAMSATIRTRFSSLSAIKSRFRDSSGFRRGLFPNIRGPFEVARARRAAFARFAAVRSAATRHKPRPRHTERSG